MASMVTTSSHFWSPSAQFDYPEAGGHVSFCVREFICKSDHYEPT